MRALTIVEAWARENAELLLMACRSDVALDLSTPIQRHLFTADPAGVRRLLDAPLRVHLLAEVPSHADGWVCAPLN